ncbi:MAG: 4-aminobutyrate--2-oxoglutarate transaminase [Armatimonadetes bacterium]|nr:4-aminobutyrate--2-oxoglutarate transaminase [Armatimonadota bacterium]
MGRLSTEWQARKARAVARAIGVQAPWLVTRAEGALLYRQEGRPCIDLTGGWGCLAVGHSHPRVVRAIQEQAARFTHTDFSAVPYESYIALAERLVVLAPGRGGWKAALFNSGAEAVENAVKIARAATGRPAILAFEGAFHGRTYMAMSLTSKVFPYKWNFGPFVPEVYRVPFPYPYRSPVGPERAAEYALSRIEEAFCTVVAPERVAAVIVEPVQGEGGFIVPPPEFLPGLRTLCDRHGILLIADEIQTGLGRTGRWWAVQHWGVEPDLVTVAKSLAAGLPLSAVLGRAEVLDALPEGTLGGTYVGNPVACAAALAVLDVIEEEGLLARAEWLGRTVRDRFVAMQARFPLVGDVRGLGAMVAMELVRDRGTKAPAPEETAAIIGRAMAGGVVLPRAGIYNNVIRVMAPLVITEEQITRALDVLENALAAVLAQGASASVA